MSYSVILIIIGLRLRVCLTGKNWLNLKVQSQNENSRGLGVVVEFETRLDLPLELTRFFNYDFIIGLSLVMSTKLHNPLYQRLVLSENTELLLVLLGFNEMSNEDRLQ